MVTVHALVAPGVTADKHREILGYWSGLSRGRRRWLAFLRGLVARGLSGVQRLLRCPRGQVLMR